MTQQRTGIFAFSPPPHTRQTAKRAFEMLKAIANYILTSLTPRYHYIGPVRKTFSKTMGTE